MGQGKENAMAIGIMKMSSAEMYSLFFTLHALSTTDWCVDAELIKAMGLKMCTIY